MPHAEIKDAWIAENAMVTSGLLGRMRDNIIALHDDTTGAAFKTDDESVTSDTTLHDDNTLFFTAGANEIWHVHISIEYTTGAAGDFKFQLTPPSCDQTGYMVYATDEPGVGEQVEFLTATCNTPIPVLAGAITDGHVYLDAYLLIGAAGGSVNFQWAQNTSNGTATTVGEGSLLIAHRLDVEDGAKTYTEILAADTDGKSPGETGLGELLRDNPIALYDNVRAHAIKDADETVNNDDTVQADDDLLFPVGLNETWQFMAVLRVTTTTIADWLFGFQGPAGSSGVFGYMWTADPTPPGAQIISRGAVGAVNTLTELIQWDDAAVGFPVLVEGYVSTAGTGGNLTLQWAQGTPEVSDTKVLEGSFIIAHRLDTIAPGGATFAAIPDADIDPESDIGDSSDVFAVLADNAPAVYNMRDFATKAGDETVNNSDTLQDDDDLIFSIGANETWAVAYVLSVESTAAADFQLAVETPDGGDVGHFLLLYSGHEAPPNFDIVRALHVELNTALSLAYAQPLVIIAHGLVSTGSTAGTVTLQWAQDTAVAVDTKVLAGSFVYARRMDNL